VVPRSDFSPQAKGLFFYFKNQYEKAKTGSSKYARRFKESRDGGKLHALVSKLTLELQAELK